MLPITPGPSVPPENVTLVPAPVAMQPVPGNVPTGNQVTVVNVTVAPPPEQFASFMVPIAVADAAGMVLNNASAAIPPIRYFRELRYIVNPN